MLDQVSLRDEKKHLNAEKLGSEIIALELKIKIMKNYFFFSHQLFLFY